MNSKTILLIDDEPKNIEVLVSGLVNNHFQVVTASSAYSGLDKTRHLKPDIILMDTELPDLSGVEFVKKLREDTTIAEIPVTLLSTREGIQDRLKAYEAGAKDFIVKPLHVNEILARIKMTLSRLERRLKEQESKGGKISGKLEDKCLAELIREFSMNRATGILTVTSIFGKSGQVFFRQGQIVNAIVGNFRCEQAVYQMIPWSSGKYTMVFQDIDVMDEIRISNLGILLQARKRVEKRAEILKQLPSLDTVFTLSSTFLQIIEKRQVSGDVMRFIQLFNGQRTTRQIVEESFQDDLVTLDRILKMHQQGFLKEISRKEIPKKKPKDAKTVQKPIFTEEEFQTFRKNVLEPLENNRNTLLILGTTASGKNDMTQTLAGSTYQAKTMKNQFPHPIDIGKSLLYSKSQMNVLGIPIEKNLHLFVDSIEKNMFGYIILINAIEPDTFEYLSYLIKTFRNRYQLPYVTAVSNSRHPKAEGIENIAQKLGLENYEEIIPCEPQNIDNIKMLLLNMQLLYVGEKKAKTQYKFGQVNN